MRRRYYVRRDQAAMLLTALDALSGVNWVGYCEQHVPTTYQRTYGFEFFRTSNKNKVFVPEPPLYRSYATEIKELLPKAMDTAKWFSLLTALDRPESECGKHWNDMGDVHTILCETLEQIAVAKGILSQPPEPWPLSGCRPQPKRIQHFHKFTW